MGFGVQAEFSSQVGAGTYRRVVPERAMIPMRHAARDLDALGVNPAIIFGKQRCDHRAYVIRLADATRKPRRARTSAGGRPVGRNCRFRYYAPRQVAVPILIAEMCATVL